MGFFRDFNFVRAIILLSLGGSGALGYLAYEQHEQLLVLRDAVVEGGEVEKLVSLTQARASLYSQLVAEKDDDVLLHHQKNHETYIRQVATKDHVEIGSLKIDPGERRSGVKGIRDKTFRISPSDSKRSFYRTRIANFLYSLENDSRHVRVTDIKISNAASGKIDIEVIPEDRWTFEATITSREKATP